MMSHIVDHRDWPSFSIIVATYNRPQRLAACLESLACLDYPPTLVEVIVVDDGGDTSLEPVISPFRSRLRVRLLRQAHAGPGAARNAGAAHASGEFLAFTDDDCQPAPDWLRALALRFLTTPEAVIGGLLSNALPDNIYSAASDTLMAAVFAYFNRDPSHARNLISGNLALSRAGFQAVGGFDPTLMTSEDRDFSDRCLEHGHRLSYAPEVVVYHVRPLTLRTFWRQHFEYGRGTFHFYQRRARRVSSQFAFDAGFYMHVLRYPFVRKGGARALVLCGLLTLTQAAKTVGLLWESGRHLAGRRRVMSRDTTRGLDQASLADDPPD